MKRISILTAALLLAVTGPAPAANSRNGNTFAGSCDFKGTVLFRPPLTNEARPARGSAHAAGPCTGTFTDPRGHPHELHGDFLTYVAANRGSMSCGGGIAEGGGYLLYGRHKLRFGLTEERAGGGATLQLDGRRGGFAAGEANVSPEEDPLEILARCNGPGLGEAAVEIRLTSPEISG